MRFFRKIGDKLFYGGGIFHPTKGLPLRWEKDLELAIRQKKKIINIGAGQYYRKGVISIDPFYKEEDEYHIRAFGENLPLKNNSIDFVICCALLEHVKEPKKIIKEIYRVLKPGGKMHVSIAFLFPFHAAPNDYNRLTIYGLEYLCRDFKKIQSGMSLGPNSAIACILVEYSQIFFKNKLLKKIAKSLTKIIVFPIKYFDKLFINRKEAVNLAGVIYFYGEKKH